MKVSLSQAKAQLTELVRRAEDGEEVVLTRHGQPAVRLVPENGRATPRERERVIREAMEMARKTMTPGPCAARSQDYLYDENGLPA